MNTTLDELVALLESGLTSLQIDRLIWQRWLLQHEGRIGNRLATPDLLRMRQGLDVPLP